MKRKASMFPNMVTYIPVRRKDWVTKVSIMNSSSILIVGYNVRTTESVIKHFVDIETATSYLDFLVEQENL